MRKSHHSFSLFVLLAMALMAVVFVSGVSAAGKTYPPIINLPDNFNPEGVVTGRGPVIYAGSLAGGAIYEANLITEEGDILVDGHDGAMAVGLAFDARSNYLFVSGGAGGTATVYDAATGELVKTYQLADPANPPFINDAVVTRDAAYFTNSFAKEFYRLPLGPRGALPEQNEVEIIPLGDDFDFVFNPFVDFNANGIEASQNGKQLLVMNSQAAALYRVDPTSGEALAVDLDGDISNGDGLVLVGRTLYVVQNASNQISEIQMANDFLSGQVIREITDPAFRVPTTAANFGSYLYAVNARFGQDTGADPSFEIVQVKR
jgi:sugar lactone lactonase YvrE